MIGDLRLDDPEQRYAAVRLCADIPLRRREFQRDNGGWVLPLPPMQLARLEYQLELSRHDGSTEVVCDPGNPRRAPGAFGEKSVVVAPDYRPPDWLDVGEGEEAFERLEIRILGRTLDVRISSPGEGELPLLIAHDGPEYDALASLTRYADAMIERGVLPPFRVALLPPGDRDEWYSASAVYGRALCGRIVPALHAAVPVAGRPVGMGTSLGALAMLQAQRTSSGTFAALFLQSGTFFMPRFDSHESGFPRYDRIVRFVSGVLSARSGPGPLPVMMTCGAEEENIHNNRVMAAALGAQGYDARLYEVPDLHNYTSWRDSFDPYLTDLLQRLWSAR